MMNPFDYSNQQGQAQSAASQFRYIAPDSQSEFSGSAAVSQDAHDDPQIQQYTQEQELMMDGDVQPTTSAPTAAAKHLSHGLMLAGLITNILGLIFTVISNPALAMFLWIGIGLIPHVGLLSQRCEKEQDFMDSLCCAYDAVRHRDGAVLVGRWLLPMDIDKEYTLSIESCTLYLDVDDCVDYSKMASKVRKMRPILAARDNFRGNFDYIEFTIAQTILDTFSQYLVVTLKTLDGDEKEELKALDLLQQIVNNFQELESILLSIGEKNIPIFDFMSFHDVTIDKTCVQEVHDLHTILELNDTHDEFSVLKYSFKQLYARMYAMVADACARVTVQDEQKVMEFIDKAISYETRDGTVAPLRSGLEFLFLEKSLDTRRKTSNESARGACAEMLLQAARAATIGSPRVVGTWWILAECVMYEYRDLLHRLEEKNKGNRKDQPWKNVDEAASRTIVAWLDQLLARPAGSLHTVDSEFLDLVRKSKHHTKHFKLVDACYKMSVRAEQLVQQDHRDQIAVELFDLRDRIRQVLLHKPRIITSRKDHDNAKFCVDSPFFNHFIGIITLDKETKKPCALLVPPHTGPNSCAQCGSNTGKLMKCSACKKVYYCTRQCQIDHWKAGHKASCGKEGEHSPAQRPAEAPRHRFHPETLQSMIKDLESQGIDCSKLR